MTKSSNKKRKIEESELLYRQIFNFSPVAIWEKDDEALYREIELLKTNGITNFRKYLDENPSEIIRLVPFLKLKNVKDESILLLEAESKEEILSGFQRLFTEESLPVLKEGIIGVAEGKKRLNIHSVLKSFKGTRLEILFGFDFSAGNSINESLVTLTDVTALKNAEKALKESDERLRLATQTSGVGIWEWNVITNKIRWDAQMFHIYGVTPTADGFIEYQTWSNAVASEDLTEQERILQDTVKNSSTSNRSFKIYRANDGVQCDIEAIETTRTNAQGETEWVVGTNMDVTDEKRASEKIKESEKQYHHLIYSSPSAIGILYGEDLVITIANEPIIKIWGKGKDILGKKYFEALPELAEQGYKEVYAQVYKTGVPFSAVETPVHILQDGKMEFKYYNFILQPQHNVTGEIIGVAIIATEVTSQAEHNVNLRESEERFRSLADNVAMHIFIIEPNEQATISYWNKNWLDYTGQTIEEALGRAWEGIIHPDDVQCIMDVYIPAFEKRQPYFLNGIRIKRHDGEYRWHSVKSNPRYLSNGEFMGYIGVGVDIHESKLLEKDLIEAKVIAEKAVEFKQQFLSNMSHEIRTPLNSILGFTNVLLKTELGIDQKEFVQAIKTSGKTLNVLINDILDLAKVDAGKMTFEKQPFEIRESITSILHSFNPKIQEKNLEFVNEYDSNIPSMLLGDSVRLNQIILNLMSNAVKFTHKGKIILSVKLLNEDKENATLEFAVTDTGIGIADDKINSIFNVFEQAEHSTSNSYGGTGLGLAIVKQLVETQGGSISLKSKLGEGSTFTFILPFGKTNIKSVEEIEILQPDSEIKKLRVLVAEDVILNQLLIKIILSDFGFEYEIVANGKMAIEKMQTNTYDIILMDLQMPEMNGFEATDYMRKTMKSKIPIIALTADVTTVDVSKCKEFGMDDYISKPINENLLYSKIVALVKEKQ